MATLIYDIRVQLKLATAALTETRRMMKVLTDDDAAALAALRGDSLADTVAVIGRAKESLEAALRETDLTDLALHLLTDVDADEDPDEAA